MMSGLKEHLIDIKTLDPESREKAEVEIKELFPENEVDNAEDCDEEVYNKLFKTIIC